LREDVAGRAAGNYRLAACAPQNLRSQPRKRFVILSSENVCA
jgi:hypothetical protein